MTAKQIARSIKRRKTILSISIWVFIPVIYLINKYLFDGIYRLLIFPMSAIFGVLYISNYKKILETKWDILTAQGDPELFLDVYELTRNQKKQDIKFNKVIYLMCDFFKGNYNKVTEDMDNDSGLLNTDEFESMSYYIQAAFFTNDTFRVEKGYDLINIYRNNIVSKPQQSMKDFLFSTADFAYYYLNGDYENAYKACKNYTEPPKNMPILKFYNMYYTALCERDLGNEEAALEKFRYIASQNNTLDVTRMAKEMLK